MILLTLFALCHAAACALGRYLKTRSRPVTYVARSVGTGPVYLGGSVRQEIAPDRDTLYREAASLAEAGQFDAAAEMLIAASAREEK